MHPSKGRLSQGRQHVAGYVVWADLLSAVALRTLFFTHFKLFYFPNVIGLVQQIDWFVMRTEPKASYRTVQYEYVHRFVTPLIYCIYIHISHVCVSCLFSLFYKTSVLLILWLYTNKSRPLTDFNGVLLVCVWAKMTAYCKLFPLLPGKKCQWSRRCLHVIQ